MIINQDNNYNLLLLILGALVGVILGFDSSIWGIFLFIIFLFLSCISFLIYILLQVLKKKILFLLFLIPATLGLSVFTFYFTVISLENIKGKNATILVEKIEKFKLVNGKYPIKLTELGIIDISGYSYISNNNTFELSYIRDGWHCSKYNSKTKEWHSND